MVRIGRVRIRRDGDERHRRPGLVAADEAGGRHADDGGIERSDLELLPEDVAPFAESRLPEHIAEHDDCGRGGNRVFSAREKSSKHRMGVEQIEIRRAHRCDLHLARILTDSDRQISQMKDRALGERARFAREIQIASILNGSHLDSVSAVRVFEIDAIHARRIAQIRERPEHQPVDDAEHRGVRANAECERGDDGEGESGARAQSADGVAQIAHRILEQLHAARIAGFFLYAIDAAEGQTRATLGLLAWHAVPLVLCGSRARG